MIMHVYTHLCIYYVCLNIICALVHNVWASEWLLNGFVPAAAVLQRNGLHDVVAVVTLFVALIYLYFFLGSV